MLAVLVSRDGTRFDQGAILRDAGKHRYAYASAIEQDGRIWVIYSIDKHGIAVSNFPMAELG